MAHKLETRTRNLPRLIQKMDDSVITNKNNLKLWFAALL